MEEKSAWHKSPWIGLGAFTIAATVSVISTVWPKIIRPHPFIVFTFLIAGIFCLLIPVMNRIYLWITEHLSRENKLSEPSPLEIIFEPLNPGRKFWSLESKQDFYKRVTGPYWEYRVEIKNISPRTLRNVAVTVGRIGASPEKP
jgi:hypothetical protein